MAIVRTTFQVPELLLYRLKVQALKEGTDVSRLLCKIADAYIAEQGKREPSVAAQVHAAAALRRARSYGGKPKGSK